MSKFGDILKVAELREMIVKLRGELTAVQTAETKARADLSHELAALREKNRFLRESVRAVEAKLTDSAENQTLIRQEMASLSDRLNRVDDRVRAHERVMRSSQGSRQQDVQQMSDLGKEVGLLKSEHARLAKQLEIDNKEARSAAVALHEQIRAIQKSNATKRSDPELCEEE